MNINSRKFSNRLDILILGVVLLLQGQSADVDASETLSRPKRGASVYPVFGGGSSHGPTFTPDPSPFAQYVGGGGHGSSGGGSSYSSSSHSGPSSFYYAYSPQAGGSGYSHSPAPAPMYSSTAFDTNHLNAYSQHMGSNSRSSSPAPASGWSPSGSLGYGGSFYTSDYGHSTPNFANAPASSHSPAPNHSPSLSAHSLAQSAQTSFYAQNNLYNVLLAGSHRPTYKGSAY